MTYAIVFDIPGSVELYRAAHAQFQQHPTGGLVLHVARPTDDGVQVVEVWTSAEAYQEWMEAYAGPAMGALAAAGWDFPPVAPTPFAPVGVVVPAADISV